MMEFLDTFIIKISYSISIQKMALCFKSRSTSDNIEDSFVFSGISAKCFSDVSTNTIRRSPYLRC